MLSKNENTLLMDQLKTVFHPYIHFGSDAILHAAVRLAVDALHTLIEMDEPLLDIADEASCGPPDHRPVGLPGSEVRCPHCRRSI